MKFWIFIALIQSLAAGYMLSQSENLWSIKTEAQTSDSVEVTDFQFHHGYSQFLRQHPQLPAYQEKTHVEFMRELIKSEPNGSLSFGYSPTMALLLGWTGIKESRWAWVGWITLSWGIIFFALSRHRIDTQTCDRWMLLFCMVSPVVLMTLYQGQTSLFTTGLLLVLGAMGWGKTAGKTESVISVVVLVLLTIKPPLALVGGVILLAQKKYRELFWAVVVTGIIAGLWCLREGGVGWVRDYLMMVSSWNKVDASAFFGGWIWPQTMGNLRGVLFQAGFRDDWAFRLSQFSFLSSLVLYVIWVNRKKSFNRHLVLALALIIYLLFCPHLSLTEEVGMIALLYWLTLSLEGQRRRLQDGLAAGACLMVVFAPAVITQLPTVPIFIFLGKLLIGGIILYNMRSDKIF